MGRLKLLAKREFAALGTVSRSSPFSISHSLGVDCWSQSSEQDTTDFFKQLIKSLCSYLGRRGIFVTNTVLISEFQKKNNNCCMFKILWYKFIPNLHIFVV